MESMTGYSFLEDNTEQFSFSVELKSLNSRYIETYLNLPKILKNEENDLQQKLKEKFQRGKLELSIDFYDWVETKPITLNSDLIKKYYKELVSVHKNLKIEAPLNFEAILSLDGISSRERTVLTKKSRKKLFETIDIIIKKTIDMRQKEGAITKNDIMNSITEITSHLSQIKKLSRQSAKIKKQNLTKRLESLMGSKIDDVRVFAEIAILADKIDVNEEIVRLSDHIKKFKSVINERKQIGRKLDFLAQEMFREINTIVSKSNNSEISHVGVEIKNHIDKIREQCRNII